MCWKQCSSKAGKVLTRKKRTKPAAVWGFPSSRGVSSTRRGDFGEKEQKQPTQQPGADSRKLLLARWLPCMTQISDLPSAAESADFLQLADTDGGKGPLWINACGYRAEWPPLRTCTDHTAEPTPRRNGDPRGIASEFDFFPRDSDGLAAGSRHDKKARRVLRKAPRPGRIMHQFNEQFFPGDASSERDARRWRRRQQPSNQRPFEIASLAPYAEGSRIFTSKGK
jgi:hypothetical protein